MQADKCRIQQYKIKKQITNKAITKGKNMYKYLFLILFFAVSYTATYAGNYYVLRNGLQNSKFIFKNTRRGRVVFLGGSITNMGGWKEAVSADLKRRFPKTKFEFINAGIDSTGSTPGAFRLKRDVFKKGKVDLLFEEAAVNDSIVNRSDKEQVRGMEGIVRHARKLNPNIDIIMMHFVDPEKMKTYNQGKVPKVIQNHEKVAERYGVPSINLALEVTERIKRGEFTWKKDFKGLHPAPFGHKIYSNTIARCLDAAWNKNQPGRLKAHQLPKKVDKYNYEYGKLYSPRKAKKLKGFKFYSKWKNTDKGKTRPGFVNVPMLVGENPGDSFEVNFKGRAVGLLVVAGPDAGIIEYKIDNGKWNKQDLFTQWSGWVHLPSLYVLAAELNRKKIHKVEVRIAKQKNKRSRGNACRVVNIAINGILK